MPEKTLTTPVRDTKTLPSAKIPQHVSVIMDGNGRWAKERGMPRSAGHKAGAESVRACLEGCLELGIPYLSLYAFSSENWKRPKSEIDTLMTLLERFLKKKTPEMQERNVRLQAIGRIDELPSKCQKQLNEAIASTANSTGITLILALNYGAREEILDALKTIAEKISNEELNHSEINKETISQHLYTSNYPDPDLLIRSSGEMRLSNFLLWQLSYTELYVTPKYWPDFKKEDLLLAVEEYGNRQRRFGDV